MAVSIFVIQFIFQDIRLGHFQRHALTICQYQNLAPMPKKLTFNDMLSKTSNLRYALAQDLAYLKFGTWQFLPCLTFFSGLGSNMAYDSFLPFLHLFFFFLDWDHQPINKKKNLASSPNRSLSFFCFFSTLPRLTLGYQMIFFNKMCH